MCDLSESTGKILILSKDALICSPTRLNTQRHVTHAKKCSGSPQQQQQLHHRLDNSRYCQKISLG